MSIQEAFEVSFISNEIKSVISTTAEVTPEIEKYLNELLSRLNEMTKIESK